MLKLFSAVSKKPSLMLYDAKENAVDSFLKDCRFSTCEITNFHPEWKKPVNIESIPLSSSEEVTHGTGEISVLCGRYLSNGLAKYPYRSRYVLFSIELFNPMFYLGAIGLVRRYIIGRGNANSRIKLIRFLKIGNGMFSPLFLQLQNPNASVTNHFSISINIGYEGFLNFLEESGKKYVVLRFFDKLPLSNREGGDMDFLVEDDLFDNAAEFLSENPGTNMIDMYSVVGPSDASRIPYHIPWLSRKILDRSVKYNSYSVPCVEDLSLIHI